MGGPSVSTWFLTGGRQKHQTQRRRDDRRRSWSDGITGFEDERGPQTKESGQPLESGKAMIFPDSFQKEYGPDNMLT